jgi:beta-phosphoglucomutase family hydrolase
MLHAVIFDMDGLMVDTEFLHHESFKKTLERYGIHPTPNAQGVIHVSGISAEANWERFKRLYEFDVDTTELTKIKHEIHLELLQEGVEAMPGLLELLGDLKKSGYKIAIASSSVRKQINLIVDRLDIADFFDAITSGEEVANGKPAPDIFLKAAHGLNVEPHECIVLEDASKGIQAAKAAGMYAVAVPNVFTQSESFDIADVIVPSLSRVNSDVLSPLQSGHALA